MTTDPERTLTMTDNTTPQPVSDADREAKYGEALGRGLGCCDGTECDECLGGAVAAIAVADAEIEATTKSLRAENERLRERFNDYRERFNGYLDEAAVRAEAAEAALAEERHENERLRQGLWDTWVALGHDTDGDTGPGALIAGMGLYGFIGMVIRDAVAWRKESEDDYDADTGRLEAALAEERAKVADLADEWDVASEREREMADRFAGYHAGARSARMKAAAELRAALAAPEATEGDHGTKDGA